MMDNGKFLNSALIILVLLSCLSFSQASFAQSAFQRYFSNVSIQIDTNEFSYLDHRVSLNDSYKIPFEFSVEDPVVLIRLTPSKKISKDDVIKLIDNKGYAIVDSLSFQAEGYYQCKVRFRNLMSDGFIGLSLSYKNTVIEIPFLPFSNTQATIYPGNAEFYIGEEKTFELVSNRPENIIPDPLWIEKKNYEYRIYREKGKNYVSILPTKSGVINFVLPIKLRRPNFNKGKLSYALEAETFDFFIKGSRLSFLQFDEREVIWKQLNREGIEIQIDQDRNLKMNKTYRIEDTDEKGGPLIAELYTIRRLGNDNVLCKFRPYNFHRISEGYLFIKDGDDAKFITNINILPEPKIEKVSVLREGGNWINSRKIRPGETVEIRLEGEGLSRANFQFEDLIDLTTDSILQNDVLARFMLKAPIDIRKKSVNIYNGIEKTGITLDISEFQQPRELDFVIIQYGGVPVIASEVTQPILHDGTIGDVNLTFDADIIDEAYQLYGKQYLELEVRIKDENNRLVEKQIIDDIEICPGSGSPRSFSYTSPNGCMNESVSINDYLSNKTHSLSNWSTVELIIKHRKNLYGGKGYTARIEIIKERQVTFDVDLSIPAGLIIKKVGVPGFPGLSGISLSMLAQFSFYQKGEIQKLRPYKIGAGFLAQNAFNFNPDAERDLGIVVLGSVYPTKKNRKFSFPLYAGMGYFLNEAKFFYLIGPGVRINF